MENLHNYRKRECNIELMRCCMMFGIVLLHVITQAGHFSDGGRVTRQLINLLSPCVAGFVFISGYYGIKFSVRKVLRLLCLAVFYAFCFAGLSERAIVRRVTEDWFLQAYLVLMFFAPLINAALDSASNQSRLRIAAPILFAVYGWSYCTVIPIVGDYVARPGGFSPLSFFTLMGIYVAAKLFRLMRAEDSVSARWMGVIGVVGCVFVLAGFHHHNSPASLCLVMAIFCAFKKLHVSSSVEKLIGLMAPSVFAIYLIHSSPWCHRYFFGTIQDYFILQCGFPVGLAYCLDAMVVYTACFCVDVVRRIFLRIFRAVYSSVRSRGQNG